MTGIEETISIGAAQVAEVYLDREATIEKDCEFVRRAGEMGLDLLVFPEFHVPASPYWFDYDADFDDFRDYYRALFEEAVTVPSPEIDRLADAANQAGTAVVLGINEKEPDTAGTMYNSQVFIDGDGELLGVRRKIVPTREERLFHTGGSGADIRAFDTPFGRLGGLMCGEHGNPLMVYGILACGTDVLASAWPANPQPNRDADFRQRHIYARTRYPAFSGKVPTVSATGVIDDHLAEAVGGFSEDYGNSGTSAVLSPQGEFLAGPKWEGEGIVHAEVDLSERPFEKAYHDVLGHYNRFDIFDVTIDRREQQPVTFLSDGEVRRPRHSDSTRVPHRKKTTEPDERDNPGSLSTEKSGVDR